jgi:hypothetical protein
MLYQYFLSKRSKMFMDEILTIFYEMMKTISHDIECVVCAHHFTSITNDLVYCSAVTVWWNIGSLPVLYEISDVRKCVVFSAACKKNQSSTNRKFYSCFRKYYVSKGENMLRYAVVYNKLCIGLQKVCGIFCAVWEKSLSVRLGCCGIWFLLSKDHPLNNGPSRRW